MPIVHDATITDFATHLVPEAFARRHSAHRVDLVTDVPSGHAAFADWVTARVAEAVVDRYPAGGRPVRFIVVEGGDGVRMRWDESPCCEPASFARRVNREIADVPTPWVFAVELPWPEPSWGAWVQEGDVRWWDRDIQVPPDPAWQATWYAEGRGRGVATIRAGVVDLLEDAETDTDTVVGQRDVPYREHAVRGYHRILRRHPARAAHHLRRR